LYAIDELLHGQLDARGFELRARREGHAEPWRERQRAPAGRERQCRDLALDLIFVIDSLHGLELHFTRDGARGGKLNFHPGRFRRGQPLQVVRQVDDGDLTGKLGRAALRSPV
jgi:hypothetical protein